MEEYKGSLLYNDKIVSGVGYACKTKGGCSVLVQQRRASYLGEPERDYDES